MRILVTGACGVTSRAVARSIRQSPRFAAAELLGTDIGANPYGFHEGLFDRVCRAPRVDEDGYEEFFRDLCRREGPAAAIVIPELEVRFWSAAGFPAPAVLPPPGFSRIAVSKRRLHEALRGTRLVPDFTIESREEILEGRRADRRWPVWVRDFSEGATSGRGSLAARDADDLRAWAVLNREITHFMVADHLPGRNFACHLLYHRGEPVRIACYERLEYFMGRTVMSGVSGNISRGRLVNDPRVVSVAREAVARLAGLAGETMEGLVAVDLREALDGRPRITEVNLRHVAATSAFAAAGFNLAEAQLLVALGRAAELTGPAEATFGPDNLILRDIDGPPLWIPAYRPPALGEWVPRRLPSPVRDGGREER